MKRTLVSMLTMVSLASVSGAALADNEAMMQAAGKQIFNKCVSCHSVDSSKNAFGPSLVGVVGRKAAIMPRFAYSDALKGSGITWTEENIRKWVAGNDVFVPGTRMRHVEITDQAEQDYLLSYLKSLK